MTLEEAYRVQAILVETWSNQGRRVVGKKVGLTNAAGMEKFGAHEPALGHLFSDMLVDPAAGLDATSLYKPMIEGELAFVFKKDLTGPGVTTLDVLRATEGVMSSVEIMDTRIVDWQINVLDLVADNCSARAFALGSELVQIRGFDPANLGFVMRKNGQVVSTGTGANVLGSPLTAVAWLANKLGQMGNAIKGGEVVLTGAATPPVAVAAGDVVQLSVDRIGEVKFYLT